MVWKNRGIAEMKSLHLIIYMTDWDQDAIRMEMKYMTREEMGDDRRQEGVRSLPVCVFHLAIPTASIVCGSF